MRQYASFLWFERTESRFMRGAEFDFARAEDKDAASEAKIKRLAEVYLAKARKNRASETALSRRSKTISRSSPRASAGSSRAGWRPSRATSRRSQTFAERAYRRPLSTAERDDIAAFYQLAARSGRARAMKTPCATRSSAC